MLRSKLLGKLWMPMLDADGGAGTGSGTGDGNGGAESGDGKGGTGGTPGNGGTGGPAGASGTPKTFTQEEVNKLMASEKESGRNSILKELGIENAAVDDTKNGLAKFREWQESQKSEAEKQAEALATAQATATKAQQEADTAKAQVLAIQKGFDPAKVDDIILVATPKVTAEKPIDKVLDEMKTSHSYFLGTSAGVSGTGNPPGTSRIVADSNYGAELAKTQVHDQKKNPYFQK